MNQTIIHIGYPKTATTWFQKKFFTKILNFEIIDRKDVGKFLITPYGINYKPKNFVNHIKNKYKKNVIISDERILGGMLTGGYNGFVTKVVAERLKQTFPDAKIVIFIRNQFDAIASAYFHYISYGGTYNINRFLHNPRYFVIQKLGLFSFEFYNYYNLIKYYKSLFDYVDVYLYEDLKEDNINFLESFLNKYNFDVNISKLDIKHINNRYRTGLFYFKKTCNLFTNRQIVYKYYLLNIPYCYKLSDKIINSLNKNKLFGKYISTDILLNKEVIGFIKEKYANSNQKLIDEYHLNKIKKYNYPV